MSALKDKALASFDALAAKHQKRLGVTYHIGPMFGPWSVIALRRNGGRKGNGARAMRELAALADKLGVVLTLGTSQKPLIPYFERFGFAVKSPLGGNYGVVMERKIKLAIRRKGA